MARLRIVRPVPIVAVAHFHHINSASFIWSVYEVTLHNNGSPLLHNLTVFFRRAIGTGKMFWWYDRCTSDRFHAGPNDQLHGDQH